GKRAVTVVVIQMVAAISRHIQIFVAVVIVVTDSHAHPVSNTLQPGLLGHVFERAVLTLVIQAVPVFRRTLLWNGVLGHGIVEWGAVNEENIQQAVVVVVEDGDTRSHGLHQVFMAGVRGHTSNVNAAGSCYVSKFSG